MRPAWGLAGAGRQDGAEHERRDDEYFIGSCYYAMSAAKTAQAAEILGKAEDAAYYGELHRQIKDAVIKEYFTQTGRLAIDSYKLKGGFVGAPILCLALAENDMQEEAFYFLLQEGYPGWLIFCMRAWTCWPGCLIWASRRKRSKS